MRHPRAVAIDCVVAAPVAPFVTDVAAGTLGHIAYVARPCAGEPMISLGDTLAALRVQKNPFR